MSPELSCEVSHCHKIKAFFMCLNSDDTITKAQKSCLGTNIGLIPHHILVLSLYVLFTHETIEIMKEI